MTTHIVAAGGGGFSMSDSGAPTALDRYLVELTGKSSPKVCFAPTASADDPNYINRFLLAYGQLHVRPMVLTLWHNAASSVARIKEADLILIGLGSTVNLMALLQAHGADQEIAARMAAGDVVLAGVAAGGGCFYEGTVTDTFGDPAAWSGGLGLVPGSFCSHFDGEALRAPVYTEAVATGVLPGGYAADDGALIHYVDGQLEGFYTEREGSQIYQVIPSTEPTASGVLVQAEETLLL
ncbi:MAG: Type 1 glutamine amidotransferase-like domain-containing protein [Propionibacteriaceae bacterium]|jgi:peptidase E|nr:Type 1 glutamine amidotransferase-like domain-containing protein [Propionibacteriaceae bacterium]